MSMKEYSDFPKALALLEPHHRIVECHIQDTRWKESYSSAEKQLVHSLSPAHYTNDGLREVLVVVKGTT